MRQVKLSKPASGRGMVTVIVGMVVFPSLVVILGIIIIPHLGIVSKQEDSLASDDANQELVKKIDLCVFDYGTKQNAASLEPIVKLGKKATPRLLEILKDADSISRTGACHALMLIKDESAVDGIANALDDSDMVVRRFAVMALPGIGGSMAIQALRDALTESKHIEVRLRASKGLFDLTNDAAHVKHLIQNLNADDENTRRIASELIIETGEPSVDALIQAMKEGLVQNQETILQMLREITGEQLFLAQTWYSRLEKKQGKQKEKPRHEEGR